MSSIAEVRAALAAAQTGIPDVSAFDYWPGVLNGVSTVAGRKVTNYGADFEGDLDSTYIVRVFVPLADYATAQRILDELLAQDGARSLPKAIEADPTLGGVVQFLSVDSCEEEGVTVLRDGLEYLTAVLNISMGNA